MLSLNWQRGCDETVQIGGEFLASRETSVSRRRREKNKIDAMTPCYSGCSSHADCRLSFLSPCLRKLSLQRLPSSSLMHIMQNDLNRTSSQISQIPSLPAISNTVRVTCRAVSKNPHPSSELGGKQWTIRRRKRSSGTHSIISSQTLIPHSNFVSLLPLQPCSLSHCCDSNPKANPREGLFRGYVHQSSSILWQRQSIVPCELFGSCSTINFQPNGSNVLHASVACRCSGNDDERFEKQGFGRFGATELVMESSLYRLMEQAGIDTAHAQVARRNYTKEITKLTMTSSPEDGREFPTRSLDLARAALEIAAEDDALVSHSPVPLPVDSYIDRLDSMALEFAGHYLPPKDRSPATIFEALEIYLYGYKGFRRTNSLYTVDARVFYLNTVLTSRLGTPVMLALIYSEIVKRLQNMGIINFSVDMELPTNLMELPHPQVATKDGMMRDGEQKLLLTPQLLLNEVLRSLKQLYWPWRENGSIGEGSGFLQAATAASRGTGMTAPTSPFDSLFNAPSSSGGAEEARARAARLRLQRGIWTSTNFGDLRRALAASERLVLLGVDNQELRDYGMLLFHSGLYARSFEYLNSYSASQVNERVPTTFDTLKVKEGAALERLLERLRLILAEQAWTGTSGPQFSSFEVPPDPW